MDTIKLNQKKLIQNICFVVLLFTISLSVFAQYDDNHLAPVQIMGVPKGLYTNFTDKPIARLTVFSDFGKGCALSVEQKSEEYYLLSNIFKTGGKEVVSKQHQIEKSLYEIIQQLFEIATSQIRKSEKRIEVKTINGIKVRVENGKNIRLDGKDYYLSSINSSGEILTGMTHPLRKNTLMGRLADICEDLYSLSQGKEKPEDEIETKMKLLIADMQNENQKKI